MTSWFQQFLKSAYPKPPRTKCHASFRKCTPISHIRPTKVQSIGVCIRLAIFLYCEQFRGFDTFQEIVFEVNNDFGIVSYTRGVDFLLIVPYLIHGSLKCGFMLQLQERASRPTSS